MLAPAQGQSSLIQASSQCGPLKRVRYQGLFLQSVTDIGKISFTPEPERRRQRRTGTRMPPRAADRRLHQHWSGKLTVKGNLPSDSDCLFPVWSWDPPSGWVGRCSGLLANPSSSHAPSTNLGDAVIM